MKTFENLKGGDLIKFRVRNGVKLVKGRAQPEWVVKQAKVNPLLCFADHVVVNHTSTGTVVDRSNFISLIEVTA